MMPPIELRLPSMLNRYTLLAVLLALAAYAVALYLQPDDAPAGVSVAAQPAPELKRAKTAPLKLDTIQAHAPHVKRDLQLPAAVQADAKQHVIASSRTANDERRHTVTTLVDAETGAVTSYDRVEPQPWLAVNTRSEVGVFYGIKSGDPVLRLHAKQDLLQVKALRIGIVGTLDSDADYFVGIGAAARW